MFQPLLKPGLSIPFHITRNCPSCKASAATKAKYPNGSIVVDFTRNDALYFECINPYCDSSNKSKYLLIPTPELPSRYRVGCFLKHRDYSLASMGLLVDGALPIKPETVIVGNQQVNRVMPDFKEIDPTVTTGPYKPCPGFLTWTDGQIGYDTWLRCTDCTVRYHATIFVSRGSEPAGYDCTTMHHKFRFEVDERENPTKLVTSWTEGARNIRGVSREIAIYVDKGTFDGREITEAEKAH